MFIRTVDHGLDEFLRGALPLPRHIGDVSFEAPTGDWSARLSRLTVDLYLYDVSRSKHPAQTATQRVSDTGKRERRGPQPMMQLSYLVSVWAGSVRDEHQLLGDVVSCLATVHQVPAEYLPTGAETTVHLELCNDDAHRPRDVWNAIGGRLKPSVTLQATTPTDSFGWTGEAPPVRSVEALSHPIPRKSQE